MIWAGNHLGFDRVLVNITQERDEIACVTYWFAAKAVVKQRAKMTMTRVVVADLGHADAFHHGADALLRLGDEQMDVIIHQAIGVDVAIGW